MRRTRIALVVTALLLATTSVVRAQHSVGRTDADCGCGTYAQCVGAEGCCPSLLSSVTQGVNHILGSVFCCPGLDARHDIYRAALHRNDFGKCNWFLPIYSCRKCCCGTATTGCSHCGQVHVTGEEVIDMQQVPEGLPTEATPAMEPTPAVEPATPAASKAASMRHPVRGRTAAGRSTTPTTSTKQAHNNTSRDRLASSEAREQSPQPVQPTAARPTAKPKSQIQRTSLLQIFQSGDSANPLRE